jgi:glycosyltransferase involved in cell wall biosynthesis
MFAGNRKPGGNSTAAGSFMKIAFVFPPIWTPHSDGSLQIWNREVANRLAGSHDVLVYSGDFDSEHGDCVRNCVHYRPLSMRWDNRIAKCLRFLRGLLGIKSPLFKSDLWYPEYCLKVALDLRKQRCDVAHVHYYPQFAALIKRLNPDLRVVLHMHGEWLTQVKFSHLSARLSKIDLVISCSEFVTEAIRKRFPTIANHCLTVPMGVSPDVFSSGWKIHQAEDVFQRRLLCVGRISPEKGTHVLLDAFELIVRQYPDATLTVVGPEWIAPREDITDLCLGKEIVDSLEPFYRDGYLNQLKQKLSPAAAKQVKFVGLTAHGDIPKFYESADIYVSPSLYESFGVSILEAMVAGVPVVSTRIGAVPELISDGRSGLVVGTADPSDIADAVLRLFTNAELRNSISCAAHEAVRGKFSWEAICSMLVQIYGSAAASEAVVPAYAESGRK